MPQLTSAFAGALLLAAPTVAEPRAARTDASSVAFRIVVHGETEAIANTVLAEMEAVMRRELRTSHIDAGDFSTANGELSFVATDAGNISPAADIARRQISIAAISGKYATLSGADNWEVRITAPNQVTLRPTKALLDAAADSAMITVRDLISRRLIDLGAHVDQAKRIDAQNILVEIRGVTDVRRVRAVITRPARLRVSQVDLTALPERVASGRAPVGSQILVTSQGERVAVSHRVLISNEHLTDAYGAIDKLSNGSIIAVRLNDLGTQRLANFTRENVGRSFAIVMDNLVLATPIINRPMTDGVVQIGGNFSREEAADIALSLRAGPLPINVSITAERVVQR